MKSPASISQAKLMPASGRGNSLELALEVSELRYRRLFETAQDGILILDANTGKIIDVNPFLLDLLDYPFESMTGLQLWEIGLFEDIAANQAAFEALQTNEYIRYENLPLRTKAGRKIQVEFVSNVYFVGSDKVIQCNIRDISARAEFQAASKSHAATLELAVRARDEVIAVLSHELRTPLAAISSMIDVLDMGHGEVGMPDKKDLPPLFDKSALAFIRRNVQSLVHLVAELLDFTHVANEALGLELVKVDAHEVIRFALRNLESQQKGAGIGVDLRLEAQQRHIRADAHKLEQILSNLIGNALKFTPKGGKVSIVTRNEANGRLVIEVSDTGIGIPADALSRIFSPFEQADSSIHSRYGGLGLGLSIARTLVKAHGGSLEVESKGPGQGAKFTARFKIDDLLSDLTAQGHLQRESSLPPGAKTGVATAINSANGKL
jgi:PAS domain S-box-containing protein